MHYNQLRNIRATISHSPSPPVFVPPRRQRQLGNEQMIERLVNIAYSPRTQLQAEGYSRYYREDRPFRSSNPHQSETLRCISEDNQQRESRIQQMKPAIGTTRTWDQQYEKALSCRKNLSRYQEDRRSKAEIQLSPRQFIPQHLREYAFTENLDTSVAGMASIPHEKLFQLP